MFLWWRKRFLYPRQHAQLEAALLIKSHGRFAYQVAKTEAANAAAPELAKHRKRVQRIIRRQLRQISSTKYLDF